MPSPVHVIDMLGRPVDIDDVTLGWGLGSIISELLCYFPRIFYHRGHHVNVLLNLEKPSNTLRRDLLNFVSFVHNSSMKKLVSFDDFIHLHAPTTLSTSAYFFLPIRRLRGRERALRTLATASGRDT